MDRIKSYLRHIDIFKIPINLKYNDKNYFKSFYGGIVSLTIISIIVLISIYLLSQLINKTSFHFIKSIRTYENHPKIRIDKNYEPLNFSNEFGGLYFFYSFAFFDRNTNKYLNPNLIKENFFLEFKLRTNKRDLETSKIIESEEILEYDLCSNLNLFIPQPLSSNININNYVCVKNDNLLIQGSFIEKEFSYIQARVYPCNNKKNLHPADCKINASNIQINNKYNFEISFSSYNLDIRVTGNKPPLDFSKLTEIISIDDRYTEKINLMLAKDKINSIEEIFLAMKNPINYYGVKLYNKEYQTVNFEERYVSLNIRSNIQFSLIERSYNTVVDLFAIIAGIIQLLFFIGALIVIPINSRIMVKEMANRLFNLIDSGKREIINKIENYSHYFKNQDNNNFKELIASENKTKLEIEICINLYKFDRNRGISISAIEIFLDTLKKCIFCKKKKINKYEHFGIEEDVNEFNEEKEDFETIVTEAEKRINSFLRSKVIFRFLREIDALKNSIFKEKKKIIELGNQNYISLKNIDKIQNIINQESNFNDTATAIALNKSNRLIEGLRGMKNKPLLEEKQDLNLLTLLEFDNNAFADNLELKNSDNEKSNVNSNDNKNVNVLKQYFLNNQNEIEEHYLKKKKEINELDKY